MPEEKKKERKKKLQDLHATGKFNHIWKEMSEQRQGSDNPAAKNIMWYGQVYNKLYFEKNIGNITDVNILKEIDNRDDCYFMFDPNEKMSYDIIKCPYCLKESKGNKPSSFKRWHFENCKEKK